MRIPLLTRFILLSVMLPAAASNAQQTVTIDASWLNSHGPAPYYLDQPGTTYLLGTDVTTLGSAFGIVADNVTLDLNGHTVTYDNARPIIVSNGSFESGQTDWDFSQAPDATVAQGTFVQPVSVYDGNFAVRFTLPVPDQSFRSLGTVTLEADTTYALSAMFYSPDYPNNTATLYAALEGSTVNIEQTGTNWRGFQYTFSTFKTGPAPETYHIVAGIRGTSGMKSGTKAFIDDIQVRRYAAHGVTLGPVSWRTFFPEFTRYSWTKGCTVKNGRLVQGSEGAVFGNGIMIGDNDRGHEIADLSITVHGPNSVNITGGSAHRIHHNTLVNNVRTIRSRDGFDGTVLGSGGPGTEIYNNIIEGGCQNGIVLGSGDADNPVKVHDNTIALKSKYTNGFAINSWGPHDVDIYNNTINSGEGDYSSRGIFAGGGAARVKIYGNTIKVQELPRNQEYNGCQGGGGSGAYGIQFESGNDIEAYGNDVTAYATQCSAHAMRMNFELADRGINVHDNTFRGVRNNLSAVSEPNLHASSLKIDGGIDSASTQLAFADNILISNDRWLSCSAVQKLQFTGTTFIRGPNTTDPFQPLVAYRYYLNTRDIPPLEQLHFVDNRYPNDATRALFEGTSIYDKFYSNFGIDPLSSLSAGYSYSLTVKNAKGSPVAGAAIVIKGKDGVPVFTGSTGSSGTIETVLDAFADSGGAKTVFNPYTVSVEAAGHAHSEIFSIHAPLQATVTLDISTGGAPSAPSGLRLAQ